MAPGSKVFSFDVGLTWVGDRRASLTAPGRPSLIAAPPEGFPGGDRTAWTPEHLFLSALVSCTMLSFLAHADHGGVDVVAYGASSDGTIMRRPGDGRYAFVEVRMRPRVVVAAGQIEAAHGLLGKAERDCFITASTTAQVLVDWEITEA